MTVEPSYGRIRVKMVTTIENAKDEKVGYALFFFFFFHLAIDKDSHKLCSVLWSAVQS